ncbi:RNA polymerase subunit sigma-24 [Actinoplanes lobatus]|uniref:RNA polymerase sigma-70 factor (ECF subfamily) n=1 Tax=Actinoplanes lobatus TaxID=113568 RepID=A0A7W7HKA6_9ACTN|nr:sigma-70 family RNA polymerase sigma factor [Actinoplanes lobatus]MBB4751747.1 RNA polymerase sigma-70 factor (ECF subfamily) [Actinoplanes lobatus]GGN65570.1 RNA polymerase subunit sigma-24 [Actinoplanes lobatus]GIE43329.1 RNA polymerase subunit sigma-24 [Actinoplanes lobatus]
MSAGTTEQAITRAHRQEWARLVAGLARRFGDLDIAEEATAEAFAAAAQRWPREGVPPNPGGWLATTASRKAIDWLRREAQRDAKHQAALIVYDDSAPEPTGPVEDDRLRLVFTCCHPALAMDARVALTLRLLGGLTVAEIARAFLVRETAMAQRITRAKTKIRAAGIPYRVPSAGDIRERLAGVLAVVYLIFNEGYLAGEGDDPVRADLTDEAIRLGRLLRDLLPGDGEVAGLLALMLFTDARRRARVSGSGELVILAEQDRGLWDRHLIAEGAALVRERIAAVAAGGPPAGRYQLLAAINAVHTEAPSARETRWPTIIALYDRMARLDPSPIVRLNRAVAVAEVDGPAAGLAEIDRLADVLDGYHAFHAARADLLRRLDDGAAAAAYDRAVARTDNAAERAYLIRRRDQLRRPDDREAP